MNDHEAERLAAAAHELRPDWPTKSVLTLIRRHWLNKPRRDIAVILAWVACESGTDSPARALEPGPWWRAAAVEAPTANAVRKHDTATCCSVCSLPQADCETRWAGNHAFVTVAQVIRNAADPDWLEALIAETHADIQGVAMAPETTTSLDDLTDRDPALKARVDAVRTNLHPMWEPADAPARFAAAAKEAGVSAA